MQTITPAPATITPAPASKPVKKRRVHVRYSNRTKCLLCYLVALFLPLMYQAAGLWLVYPYKLAGAAPNIAANVASVLPFAADALASASQAATLPTSAAPDVLLSALTYRQNVWFDSLCVLALLAWAVSFLLQLLWRFTHSRAIMPAQAATAAIRSYRVTQAVIWLVNALFAFTLWLFGVQFIQGRTLWDYAVYFGVYLLTPLCTLCCFRLAAPPALSGKHGFFKRL